MARAKTGKKASEGSERPRSRRAAKPPASSGRAGKRSTATADGSIRGLVELGLTLGEARAYLSLLSNPFMTAAEVAAAAGMARPKVYEALRLLEERGFARSVAQESVTRYRPEAPQAAIEGWLRQREHERTLAAEHDGAIATDLVAHLPDPVISETSTEFFAFVEGVYGRARTSEALGSMTAGAKQQILNMTQPPWTQPRAQWNVAELAALKRGVVVRTLLTPAGIVDPERWQPLAEQGAEIRVADEIPMKLIVCDGTEAMISLRDPTTGEQGLSNVIIRHPDVVHSLELLFADQWDRAGVVSTDK